MPMLYQRPGHGRHACSRRFFVVFQLKTLQASIVMNYENEPPCEAPGEQMVRLKKASKLHSRKLPSGPRDVRTWWGSDILRSQWMISWVCCQLTLRGSSLYMSDSGAKRWLISALLRPHYVLWRNASYNSSLYFVFVLNHPNLPSMLYRGTLQAHISVFFLAEGVQLPNSVWTKHHFPFSASLKFPGNLWYFIASNLSLLQSSMWSLRFIILGRSVDR